MKTGLKVSDISGASPDMGEEEFAALVADYTVGQRGLIGEKVATRKHGVSRSARLHAPGPTDKDVALQLGISVGPIRKARRLRRDAHPGLVKAVEDGKLTLHSANQIAQDFPKAEQTAVAAKVIEASKGRARNTPVADVLRGKRIRRQPRPERQLANAIAMLSPPLDGIDIAMDRGAAMDDAMRLELAGYRTRISRMIKR